MSAPDSALSARRKASQGRSARPGGAREGARCLVLTPATQFGSWRRLERFVTAAPDVEWIVVSYGRPDSLPSHVRVFSIPGSDYVRLARLMARRRYHALNIIYSLPIAALAWAVGIVYRPKLLLGNGLVASAALLPLKLLGAQLVIGFHGYIGNAGPLWKRAMRRVLAGSDLALVNSKTSFDDLRTVIDADKIVVVPNWADDVFFEVALARPKRGRLVILYVGRLDTEKFAQCLRVSSQLSREGTAELWAVGAGPLEDRARGLEGVRLFGYVEGSEALAAVYAGADIVWAPADSTYLSSPGIEGLAAGCPVIVSDIPAVDARAEAGVRIPRDLVPPDIGFVVDGKDDREALAILRRLTREGIPIQMRAACRQFAARDHSVAVVHKAVRMMWK